VGIADLLKVILIFPVELSLKALHDVLGLSHADFRNCFSLGSDGLLFVCEGASWLHEHLNVAITFFVEFSGFFAAFATSFVFFILPNLSSAICVADSIVVNNEVIILALVLSSFVFGFVNLFENMCFLFDLKNG